MTGTLQSRNDIQKVSQFNLRLPLPDTERTAKVACHLKSGWRNHVVSFFGQKEIGKKTNADDSHYTEEKSDPGQKRPSSSDPDAL